MEYSATFTNSRTMGRLYLVFLLADVLIFASLIVFRDAINSLENDAQVYGLAIAFIVFSILPPFLLARTTRLWRIRSNRLEIEERHAIPVFPARSTILPFADIRAAQTYEGLAGWREIELQNDGRSFVLGPAKTKPGGIESDREGFDVFVDALHDAIQSSGATPPAMTHRPAVWDGGLGVFILAAGVAIAAAGLALGVVLLFDGEAQSGVLIVASGALGITFCRLLLQSWRRWLGLEP